MKKKEFYIVNILLALIIGAFSWMTFSLSTNKSPKNPAAAPVAQSQETDSKHCSKSKQLNIGNTGDPYLKRLKDYQDVCSSFVTNKLMIFTSFSGNRQDATDNAATMAKQLKDFHKAGVSPIIIMEPYANNKLMPYKAYLAGQFDDGMDYYFQQLKQDGVTDEMMGTWVPFPESNVPSWDNKDSTPHDFALCVNKYLTKLKQYFPGAKGSVLLNATTYEPDDKEWENGDYISLTPYVDAIDKNLVNSFGIQGFPWMSNAQQRKRTIFKAQEFLQPDLAIGAAQVLRTRDIWINTGTFASKYTNDSTKTVHLSIGERKALLDDILQTALTIRDYQENQYRVSINLFSEDKSNTKEATDWSYFQNKESRDVLKYFLTQTNDNDIPISLYDKAKWQLH